MPNTDPAIEEIQASSWKSPRHVHHCGSLWCAGIRRRMYITAVKVPTRRFQKLTCVVQLAIAMLLGQLIHACCNAQPVL